MPYRTRTRGNYPVAESCTAVYTKRDGTSTSVSTTYANVGDSTTTNDYVTPGFRKIVAKGGLVNNPFSSTTISRSSSRGSRSGTYKGTAIGGSVVVSLTRNGNNGVPYYTGITPGDVSSNIATAAAACLSNIEKPSVEGLPFLGEIRQTVQMLRNPIQAISKLVDRHQMLLERRLRNPRYRGAAGRRDVVKAISDQHLAFMFGVKPFVSDMRALLQILADKEVLKVPIRKTARGKSTTSFSSVPTSTTYNDGEVTGTVTYTSQRAVEVRAYCLYHVSADMGVNGALGLRVSDIPSALLELTPYSFLVDWVSNVGDLIAALTPIAGVTRVAEGYTTKSVTKNVSTLGSLTSTDTTNWTVTGGGDTRTYVVTEKTRVPTSLTGELRLVMKFDLNVTQISEAISLLNQKLNRFK